ncbi:MAG: hypothetical protein L3J82_04450 [Planctomycetes bacterium]|nr:hypothetical protein [Planctomycetota bacterium]
MSGISGLGEPQPTKPLRTSSTEKDGQQGGQYFGRGGKHKNDSKRDTVKPVKADDVELSEPVNGPPKERPIAEQNKPLPLVEAPEDHTRELRAAVKCFNDESESRGKAFRIELKPRKNGGLLLELHHPTSGSYAILGDRDASHIELDAIKTRLNALIEGTSGNLFNDKA